VNVLLYLVPVALMLGLIGLAAFMWSVKSGQYDDLDGAALRILPDDDIDVGPQYPEIDKALTNHPVRDDIEKHLFS
jgi:cbb3-type cytochrome oxidase maturation protein